jgi:hypothetical protein
MRYRRSGPLRMRPGRRACVSPGCQTAASAERGTLRADLHGARCARFRSSARFRLFAAVGEGAFLAWRRRVCPWIGTTARSHVTEQNEQGTNPVTGRRRRQGAVGRASPVRSRDGLSAPHTPRSDKDLRKRYAGTAGRLPRQARSGSGERRRRRMCQMVVRSCPLTSRERLGHAVEEILSVGCPCDHGRPFRARVEPSSGQSTGRVAGSVSD